MQTCASGSAGCHPSSAAAKQDKVMSTQKVTHMVRVSGTISPFNEKETRSAHMLQFLPFPTSYAEDADAAGQYATSNDIHLVCDGLSYSGGARGLFCCCLKGVTSQHVDECWPASHCLPLWVNECRYTPTHFLTYIFFYNSTKKKISQIK